MEWSGVPAAFYAATIAVFSSPLMQVFIESPTFEIPSNFKPASMIYFYSGVPEPSDTYLVYKQHPGGVVVGQSLSVLQVGMLIF